MNIHTSRVKAKKIDEMIKEQLLKKSQELFVLAFLRYTYPEKYGDVIHSDSPDLQGKTIAVEVTSADSPQDIQATKEFKKYCTDHNDLRKKTILEHSNMKIVTLENTYILCEGGGYNCNNQTLISRINDKIDKAQRYSDKCKTLELAIIKTDRPLQPWIDSLNDMIRPLLNENNPYNTIYVIFPNAYFIIEKNKDGELHQLDSEIYQSLKKIGRMTAEGELSFKDEEWN